MCVWVRCTITSKTKINVFFKKILHSGVPFGYPPLEFFSKNVDFSLWGKQQCIVLLKWTFARFNIVQLSYSKSLQVLRNKIRLESYLTIFISECNAKIRHGSQNCHQRLNGVAVNHRSILLEVFYRKSTLVNNPEKEKIHKCLINNYVCLLLKNITADDDFASAFF